MTIQLHSNQQHSALQYPNTKRRCKQGWMSLLKFQLLMMYKLTRQLGSRMAFGIIII